jgi:hypothetical protein
MEAHFRYLINNHVKLSSPNGSMTKQYKSTLAIYVVGKGQSERAAENKYINSIGKNTEGLTS